MSEAPATALIVAYRSRSTLPAVMAAVEAAHAEGLLECVVVENASGDGSAEYLRGAHPWATCIESPGNLGFGRGCNLALPLVATRYALLLNPDAVLPVEALRRLIAFLDANPRAGIVAPALLGSAGELQHAGGLPTPGRVVRTALGAAPPGWRPIRPGEPPFRTDWLCGALLLARTRLLEELGGFDPRFFLYFEETDLCRRALDRGAELVALGEAVARHGTAASARSTGAELYYGCIAKHYFESRYYYLTKHHGRLRAAAAELAELAILLAVVARRRLRGRPAGEPGIRLRAPILRLPAPPADA